MIFQPHYVTKHLISAFSINFINFSKNYSKMTIKSQISTNYFLKGEKYFFLIHFE